MHQGKAGLSDLDICDSLNFSGPLPRSLTLEATILIKKVFPLSGLSLNYRPALDLKSMSMVVVGVGCGAVPSTVSVYIDIH